MAPWLKHIAFVAFVLAASGGWEWFSKPDPDVAAGNQAFSEGEFSEALTLYERAKTTTDSKSAIRFDAGAALYKLALAEKDPDKRAQLFERAESAFREATDTSDQVLKSAAFHNIGNAMFQRERWPQAKEAYKKALRENQDNDDARYNLELVLRREKKQDKKGQGQGKTQPKNPGQGQQQKPQGGDGSSDDKSDPNGTSQGPQSQGQGQQSQDDQPGSGDDQSDQSKPGQGQKSGDPTQGKSQPPPQAGQGASKPPPQGGPGAKSPSAGGAQDPSGQDSSGDLEPGEGESMSDRDRKLDALENRSRDLRRRRLRRGGPSGPRSRFDKTKDW